MIASADEIVSVKKALAQRSKNAQKKEREKTMKKTMFDAIVNAIENTKDCMFDNVIDYKSLTDDEIKALTQVHFKFKVLKTTDTTYNAKCDYMRKRCSFNATQLVLNKTMMQYFDDIENITKAHREMLLNKNYCNIDLIQKEKTDLIALLDTVRTAYYESVAHALENAVEIELKTKAKKQRNAKDKTA